MPRLRRNVALLVVPCLGPGDPMDYDGPRDATGIAEWLRAWDGDGVGDGGLVG